MSVNVDRCDDSVPKIISELSSFLSEKLSFNKYERLKIKKEIRRNAYEIFLHKKISLIKDDRTDSSLEDLASETIFTIIYHNRNYLNPDVNSKLEPLFNKIEQLGEVDRDSRDVYSSVLKFLLLIFENQSHKKNNGIKKYLKPQWFTKFENVDITAPSKLKKSLTFCSGSILPERVMLTNIDLNGLFKSNNEELLQCSRNIRKKLSKSASWHARLEGIYGQKNQNSIFGSEISQTVDEGFVTPNDYHREITPEPFKEPINRRGDWFRWEVVKDPPSKYRTWENLDGPSKRVTWDWLKYKELNYVNKRPDKLVQGIHLPKLGKMLSYSKMLSDIKSLLLGYPSQTFMMDCESFKVSPGTYCKGITPKEMEEICSPFISCGGLYKKLEQFVDENMEFNEAVIPQVFCHTLRSYLYKYESILINTTCFPEILFSMIGKVMSHMQFLCDLIITSEDTKIYFTNILDKLYDNLWILADEKLISFINAILLECSYVYVEQLTRFIHTGKSSLDLTATGNHRKLSSFSFDKVPTFLRDLSNVALSSSKTLQILHQDKRMNFFWSQIDRKMIAPQFKITDPQESLKKHLQKHLEAKEREQQKLAEKKSEELKSILEDISSKRKWKMLEEIKQKNEDLKVEEYNEKLKLVEEKLLDQARKELLVKYHQETKSLEKELSLTKWKLKRLETKEKKVHLLKQEIIETEKMKLSINSYTKPDSEDTEPVPIEPVIKINYSQPIEEFKKINIKHEVTTRNEDAELIKKKMTQSSLEFNYNTVNQDQFRKGVNIIDGSKILNEYELNRQKALEIKNKVMSTGLSAQPMFCEEEELVYQGLSIKERQELEADLTNFGEISEEEIKNEVKNLFGRKKLKLNDIIVSNRQDICLDSINSNVFCDSFIQEFKCYLSKEVEIANSAVLGMIKDDFIQATSQLRQYFLFGNGVWSRDLAKDLCLLIQDGKQINRQSLVRLNCTLPKNFSLVLVSEQPPAFDPTNPSTADCLSLHYTAHFPINCLIYEQVIEKYQIVFNYLNKLERCSWLLAQLSVSLKTKSHFNKSLEYDKIYICKYIMNQFITTLRSHTFNGIDGHWRHFFSAANCAHSVDMLHQLHVSFIKSINLLCLLNKKSSKILKYFIKLLEKVSLFCELFRCGEWSVVPEAKFSHSNFPKMMHTFNSFLNTVRYVCEYLRKIVEIGYKEFGALLETLCPNDFYSLEKI